jgi:hypothetical protein
MPAECQPLMGATCPKNIQAAESVAVPLEVFVLAREPDFLSLSEGWGHRIFLYGYHNPDSECEQ